MKIGLTFDEYVDVKLRPSARSDRAFREGAETERDEMFPMTTAAASTHLRSRGYDCRASMLKLLVENGTIKLAQPDTCTREDVDEAAERFEEHEMFVPYAGWPSHFTMAGSRERQESDIIIVQSCEAGQLQSAPAGWGDSGDLRWEALSDS